MEFEGHWFVYLVHCKDGSLYCGMTNDLARRLIKHNQGKGAKYTRSRLPVRLVYTEPAESRSAALKREAQIKRMTRAQKMAMIDRVDPIHTVLCSIASNISMLAAGSILATEGDQDA